MNLKRLRLLNKVQEFLNGALKNGGNKRKGITKILSNIILNKTYVSTRKLCAENVCKFKSL